MNAAGLAGMWSRWGFHLKSAIPLHRLITRLSETAGLCWFSLMLSLGSNLLAYGVFRALLTGVSPASDAGLFFLIYLAVSTVLMFLVFGVRSVWLMRTFVGARVALVAGIASIPPLDNVVALLLIPPLIVEICIYEEFPKNLIVSTMLSVLVTTLRCIVELNRLPVVGFDQVIAQVLAMSGRILTLLVISWALSTAIRYRKWLIEREEKIERLSNAMSALARANLGFQEYANRAERVSTAQERKRITREIHDAVGYTMTNNIMMLEAASDMIRKDPVRVSSLIQTARENTQTFLEEVRNALHLLRAQEIPTQSGTAAYSKLARVFEMATGTNVRLELGNTPGRLPLSIEYVVYHFVQEALTNSFRHGKASEIRVLFWIGDGILTVTVRDNGGGSDHITEGIGIAGMRERLHEVGGSLEIDHVSDGFQIVARMPMEHDS